ncbi:porin family protein [Marivirga sp.]|uniref:porin family protein n=1 Tax=Marivirga sp. TaxID=2018662 RepID=UPI002D8011E2|nr:porin family protein [Marivirga sp.]HET8858863.1 porin family protein [Marivirga sp.]
MKKINLIFILFLCLFFNEQLKSQSYLGIKGGVNVPTVNFNDFTNVPITTRFGTAYFVSPTFGISYRYMQNDKIGIQADLNYSTKGWGQGIGDSTNTFVANRAFTEINYLELPFYLHWQIFGSEKFKFFLDAGVYVAWALSSTSTIQNEIGIEQVQIFYSVENDNRGDFGLYAASGFSYDFSLFILQLEGSFKTGFANILPVNHFVRENPTISTNQVPSFQVSLLFPISKSRK